MVFDLGTVFIYVAGIFILYLFCWIFLKPIKWLIRLSFSTLLGGLALLIFNMAGQFANLHIAINPLNAMTTGILGIPGMLMTLLFSNFL